MDKPNTYSCNCPEGTTLAKDGFNCGGIFNLLITLRPVIIILSPQSVLIMDLSTSLGTESRLAAIGGKLDVKALTLLYNFPIPSIAISSTVFAVEMTSVENAGTAQLVLVIEAAYGMEHSTQLVATSLTRALVGQLNK